MAERLPCIFGEYALIERLGQGAAGDVFLARPLDRKKSLPSPLVIKRLHKQHTTDDEFVRRFRHEAELAVGLDTPFIAQVYEVGQIGESLFIAMEYVPGLALNHFLGSLVNVGRYAPIAVAVQIVSDALSALELLHAGRIVHRDVSPKNLMLGNDGMLRLIDLGFAKSATQDWRTQTGVVMGSLGYMPPEQIQAKGVDARADLYAIGVVLFELLCVRRFIKPDSIGEMIKATLSNPRSPPSHFRRDVGPALDQLVLKATAAAPEDRFSSAKQFHRALLEAVPERPTRGQIIKYLEVARDDKQRARQAELNRLLAEPLPEVAQEDVTMKTTVYVERPGSQTMVRDTLALKADATAVLPAKKRPQRVPTAVMVGGALVVGLIVGSQMTAREPEPAPLVTKVVPMTVPRETPKETPKEAPAMDPPAMDPPMDPPPDMPATDGAQPQKKKLRPPTKTAGAPTKTVASPPEDPIEAIDAEQLADRVEKRANTILSTLPAGDPRIARVQQLLLGLTMSRALKDPERRLGQLQQHARDLERVVQE